ncbi:TSUP family transporter [Pseudonocardia tropica]|uniref:Probable membrane transporter protein n=1 Tax=Pseudonocardia tropica TaxID=681289 RepID=A0ABV1JXH9_9PSEU
MVRLFPDTDRDGRAVPVGVIGLVGGVVGGLIGGGSGVLFVPALDRFTAMSRARIHGSSTIANIGVCVAGAAAYAVGGGSLDLRTGAGLIVGGTVGGWIGPKLLARASETLLRVLLVVILVLTAAKLLVDALGVPLLGGGRWCRRRWSPIRGSCTRRRRWSAWSSEPGRVRWDSAAVCSRCRRWCCCSARTCMSRPGPRC